MNLEKINLSVVMAASVLVSVAGACMWLQHDHDEVMTRLDKLEKEVTESRSEARSFHDGCVSKSDFKDWIYTQRDANTPNGAFIKWTQLGEIIPQLLDKKNP